MTALFPLATLLVLRMEIGFSKSGQGDMHYPRPSTHSRLKTSLESHFGLQRSALFSQKYTQMASVHLAQSSNKARLAIGFTGVALMSGW